MAPDRDGGSAVTTVPSCDGDEPMEARPGLCPRAPRGGWAAEAQGACVELAWAWSRAVLRRRKKTRGRKREKIGERRTYKKENVREARLERRKKTELPAFGRPMFGRPMFGRTTDVCCMQQQIIFCNIKFISKTF